MGPEYLEERLEAALRENALSPADKGLTQELVFGVTRWRMTLDWLIAQKTQRQQQKPLMANILRLGLYQLLFLDRIPDHAAVNESVDLARQFGLVTQAGFVNAVLRGYAREKEAARQRLADLKINQPALGYSHPEWLVERWRSRWGLENACRLMKWNNAPPRTFARLNALRADAPALLAAWQAEGVEAVPVQLPWLPPDLVFELKSHPPLATLPSLQQGSFYVQDPSTLLAVLRLEAQPGENLLDACAAPGGKASFLAQLISNHGRIMAQDTDARRLARLRENLDRLGVTCAAVSRPSGTPCPELNAQYDRILVDAPCSNTGVMRRRIELRWRLQPREIARLEAEQIGLLRKAASHLKPGGRLVYSTCSLEPEENGTVTQRFLAEHPGWRLVEERELLPFRDGVDGAYVAVLEAPADWTPAPRQRTEIFTATDEQKVNANQAS